MCTEQCSPLWWHREAGAASCLVAFPSCAVMVDFWVLFQTRIKKHWSLLGASWDLPMPNLARWPVLSCHYREISKRQPSERGREGLWFFFFLHVWIGKYKGRREHVGRFQSWQLEAWVYKWFEASDVNKLYPGWLVFLWCLVPALRGAGWFHKLRIDTVCALCSVNSLQVHNLQFVACCFLFPHSKPWWGGGCNKTPQVLTAELIRWQNDSIWFSPCYCLFHCAFGDFPAWEMLFVIGCAK